MRKRKKKLYNYAHLNDTLISSYLCKVCSVTPVNADISTEHRWGNFRACAGIVGPVGGDRVVHSQGAMWGRWGDGLGNMAQSLGAGHCAVAHTAVGLPLLPLIQLPQGVISHRAPLLCGHGLQRTVVHRACHTTDAVRPQHVAWKRAVALGIAWHHVRPMARHVPGQSLIWSDAETEMKYQHHVISHVFLAKTLHYSPFGSFLVCASFLLCLEKNKSWSLKHKSLINAFWFIIYRFEGAENQGLLFCTLNRPITAPCAFWIPFWTLIILSAPPSLKLFVKQIVVENTVFNIKCWYAKYSPFKAMLILYSHN